MKKTMNYYLPCNLICINCIDKKSKSKLLKHLKPNKDKNGKLIFIPRYMNDGNSVNISMTFSKSI